MTPERSSNTLDKLSSIKLTRREFFKFLLSLGLFSASSLFKDSSNQAPVEINSLNHQEATLESNNDTGGTEKELQIAVLPGDSLESIAERWSVFGTGIDLIKEANDLQGGLSNESRLSIPIFLPESVDLSTDPEEYQKLAGQLGLDFLTVFKKTPKSIPRLVPPEIPYFLVNNPSGSENFSDWRTLGVKALWIMYQADAIIPPEDLDLYNKELMWGGQRLSEYCRFGQQISQGQGGDKTLSLSRIKLSDAYFSFTVVKQQLEEWNMYNERYGLGVVRSI